MTADWTAKSSKDRSLRKSTVFADRLNITGGRVPSLKPGYDLTTVLILPPYASIAQGGIEPGELCGELGCESNHNRRVTGDALPIFAA